LSETYLHLNIKSGARPCDSAGSAYLSTGRTLAPWSPSLCERLSLSPTTMRPPTLTTNILGLPDFAFRDEPPTFTGSDSARSLRQRLPIQPVPLFAVSRMEAGRFRVRRSSSFGLKIAACFSLGNLSAVNSTDRFIRSRITQDCRPVPNFTWVETRFVWTCHMTPIVKHGLLAACVAPHRYLWGIALSPLTGIHQQLHPKDSPPSRRRLWQYRLPNSDHSCILILRLVAHRQIWVRRVCRLALSFAGKS